MNQVRLLLALSVKNKGEIMGDFIQEAKPELDLENIDCGQRK